MKLMTYVLAVFLFFSFEVYSQVQVQKPRCEYQESPLDLDINKPRFSWQIQSDLYNVKQIAYQIMVATSLEKLKSEKDLSWNSNKIENNKSVFIPYGGTELKPYQTYYWKVKVWTNKGESAFSSPQSWTMSFLDTLDWKAKWIGLDAFTNKGEQLDTVINTRLAARYLRKEFEVKTPVKKAKIYISGLGLYECYINGKKISNDIFAPTASDYDKHVYYNVYDVTTFLKQKNNTIGVILGNGRYFSIRMMKEDMRSGCLKVEHYGLPKLLLQLEITDEKGEKTMVCSDTTWKLTAKGPIIANNEFDGEEYDARLELPRWTENGFNDKQWTSAHEVDAPKGKITAQPNPNIVSMQEISPISIKKVNEKYILDMGQNMVGWMSVNLVGEKDKPITMRFAELINPDGSLFMDNIGAANVTDIYTPAKSGKFSWSPIFTYHGFRYVEISGLNYTPTINDFVGKVNYDKMDFASTFETSNETLNKIWKNASWGIRGNYRSFPTDCPQRDERMAWLGDRATGCYGESFLFHNFLLYEKWIQDIEDSQRENGSVSNVAPNYWKLYADNVTWPGTFISATNMLYEQYGSERTIVKHYNSMKKWVYYMKEKTMKDFIITADRYGDWCLPPEFLNLVHSDDSTRKTSGAVLGTTVYYGILNTMAKFARITNNPADEKDFLELAQKVHKAYNEKFYNKEKAQYDNNTVTANILSLSLGLVPKGDEERVMKSIVDKTEKNYNSHVSVGVVGIQYLMRGLTNNGMGDLAMKIATNKTYPSWGYMAESGATTIWELWNGNTADNPAESSGNHVMLLGDLLPWYYENLAGIKTDKQDVGFKKIIMSPMFSSSLTFVKATFESPYGLIKSNWNKTQNMINWNITIPANSSAEVTIPTSAKNIKINGKNIQETENYKVIGKETNVTKLEIGSGNYEISFINTP